MDVPERRLDTFERIFLRDGRDYRNILKKFGENKQHVGIGF